MGSLQAGLLEGTEGHVAPPFHRLAYFFYTAGVSGSSRARAGETEEWHRAKGATRGHPCEQALAPFGVGRSLLG